MRPAAPSSVVSGTADPRLAAAAPAVLGRRLGLVDAVDHLLNRGAVVVGDATLSLAGVDLIYLGLVLVVSSVETLRQDAQRRGVEPARPAGGGGSSSNHSRGSEEGFVAGASPTSAPQPSPRAGLVPPPSLAQAVDEGAPRLAVGAPAAEVFPEEAPTDSSPEQGLARLVLTLVELLRQVLERQALRRVEGGGLSDDEV